MKNPSEELVTAWLQECKGYFTMNNVKVPKPGGKGGMSSEMDILATDGRDNLWVEVEVSTNPRQMFLKETRFKDTVRHFATDFRRRDKKAKAVQVFKGRRYRRMVVVGKLALPRQEKERFPKAMARHGVSIVHMGDVIRDLLRLRHYRLDSARGYINLIKAFLLDGKTLVDGEGKPRTKGR
jgi:hypothetical protein